MKNLFRNFLTITLLFTSLATVATATDAASHELDPGEKSAAFISKYNEKEGSWKFAQVSFDKAMQLSKMKDDGTGAYQKTLDDAINERPSKDVALVDMSQAHEADQEFAVGSFFYYHYNPFVWGTSYFNRSYVYCNNYQWGFRGFRNFGVYGRRFHFGFYW